MSYPYHNDTPTSEVRDALAQLHEYKKAKAEGGILQGGITGTTAPEPGKLEAITVRINLMAEGIRQIGYKLASHANALHGESTELDDGLTAQLSRLGQIGALEDALDDLERAHLFVAEQAGRNCRLA